MAEPIHISVVIREVLGNLQKHEPSGKQLLSRLRDEIRKRGMCRGTRSGDHEQKLGKGA